MANLTQERISAIFADMPEPDVSWHKRADTGIPQTKLAIWRALRGEPQDEESYGWVSHYAAGPNQKTTPTPNQFLIGAGSKALEEGTDTIADSANRFYDFMDAGFLGGTWRAAEFMGEGYQEMYLLGSQCILLAALRDDDFKLAERAQVDIRRHLVLDALLRVPNTIQPRSVSIGARSGLNVAPVQSMGACIIAGLPKDSWGFVFGAHLGRAADRLTYIGMGMLDRLVRAGIVVLQSLATVPEIVAEIKATKLRAPWPMHWIADEWPSWYEAWLSPPFPNAPRAESTRGKSKGALTPWISAHSGISLRHVEPADEQNLLARPHDWHLEIGPEGLTVNRSPSGVSIPPPVEPSEPELPPPEEEEPTPGTPDPERAIELIQDAQKRTKAGMTGRQALLVRRTLQEAVAKLKGRGEES